jgi:hypothetical protein
VMIVVSANENEKKHSISLFSKASEYVKSGKLLADSQYSAANQRNRIGSWSSAGYSVSKKSMQRR